MALAARCIILSLAFCARLGEGGRLSARGNPGPARTTLNSLLLASPTTLRHPQLTSAGKTEMPQRAKEAQNVAKVLSDLGLHQKAEDVMDHGRSSIDAYRRKIQRQIRKENDKDVNLMKDIFEFKSRKLGINHPGTFKSHHNYAEVLGQAGRHVEAEPLKRELFNLRRRELGPEHEDTIKTMASYIETLMAVSRYDEVEALQKDALDIACRTLGSEHPETTKALDAYTTTLTKMSRHAEAKAASKKLCEVAHRDHGMEHLNLGATQGSYDREFNELGSHSKEIPYLQKFLPGLKFLPAHNLPSPMLQTA